ncbi:MAG: MFS transporter [Candidatus Marinimicrobia bacterium]|nr:MFS transporter [Candidatus Neomarinimicrobiota bacterium]
MSKNNRLGTMMFLQYAIWGSWAPVLSAYLLDDLQFTGLQVGIIYAALPLATIVSPIVGGQVADRWFASEKVIAFLQFTGGAVLVLMSQLTDYQLILSLMFLYCLLYAPTLAITNSIAMINLDDSEEEFGKIRVWGTIGWIAAGWLLTGWRFAGESMMLSGDTLLLAGIFSIIMGIQALGLPHTPPKKGGVNSLAFLEAFKMLKSKNFLIFIAITFIVATELEFYYILTAPFLMSDSIGLSAKVIPAVMTIAQITEIFVMAYLLSRFLKQYGMRNTLAFGALAWPIRYIVFAIGQPSWLVIASIALHGFCYVFFFVAAFIYVDKVAPPDIRASAQSLIAIVALGLGRFLGSLFAGWIKDIFTVNDVTNWTNTFIVPCVLTVFCAVAFILFFRDEGPAKAKMAGETGS